MDVSKSSPHVQLAMSTIEAYIHERRTISVPADSPSELLEFRAGAFVCLKIDGHLRGCIGTIEPMHDCLAKEIIENSISAATKDPRFMPVEAREIAVIECSVDVLCEPECVSDICDLDPAKYGVIVECGSKRGLLLPDLEGVDTAEEQIGIACHKAGIHQHESIKLYRFQVNRFN